MWVIVIDFVSVRTLSRDSGGLVSLDIIGQEHFLGLTFEMCQQPATSLICLAAILAGLHLINSLPNWFRRSHPTGT